MWREDQLDDQKPRPHQQQCRSNIVKRYRLKSNKVECCFKIVAGVDEALGDMHAWLATTVLNCRSYVCKAVVYSRCN